MNSDENTSNHQTRWVKLNVGGTTFLTTRTTLDRCPGSFLHRVCQENSGLKTDKDESGAYLIERNPNYFAPVLDFLRHGELIMDSHLSEEGVLKEAEFFGLPDLVELVKLKIKDKMGSRMAELKMAEDWRIKEKFRLEEILEIKKRTKWSVRAFDKRDYWNESTMDSSEMLLDMKDYMQSKLDEGAQLDRMLKFDDGTLVIMQEPS